jgi:hypothetical protein
MGIERVTCLPTSEALVRDLQAQAEPVLARFRPAVVAEEWAALLEGVRRKT